MAYKIALDGCDAGVTYHAALVKAIPNSSAQQPILKDGDDGVRAGHTISSQACADMEGWLGCSLSQNVVENEWGSDSPRFRFSSATLLLDGFARDGLDRHLPLVISSSAQFLLIECGTRSAQHDCSLTLGGRRAIFFHML